jgi:hypothetical protein
LCRSNWNCSTPESRAHQLSRNASQIAAALQHRELLSNQVFTCAGSFRKSRTVFFRLIWTLQFELIDRPTVGRMERPSLSLRFPQVPRCCSHDCKSPT